MGCVLRRKMAFKHFVLHVEIHKAQENILLQTVHPLTYGLSVILSYRCVMALSFLFD